MCTLNDPLALQLVTRDDDGDIDTGTRKRMFHAPLSPPVWSQLTRNLVLTRVPQFGQRYFWRSGNMALISILREGHKSKWQYLDTSIVYSYTYALRVAIFLKKWFYSWIDKKKVLYFAACPLWLAWWESVCKKKDGWMTGRYMRRPVARRDSRLQDAAVCSVSAGHAPPVSGNVSRVTCHR